MSDQVICDVSQAIPTIDHYRRDWRPKPDLGMGGSWLGAIVSDASGQWYLGLRGIEDFVPGMVNASLPFVGFRAVENRLDGYPLSPAIFPEFDNVNFFEPFEFASSEGKVAMTYDSGRIEHDSDGCHWYDASGRWEIHGRPISDIATIHVGPQKDVACDTYYRHELMKATGHINGISVEGHLHRDYSYGPAGKLYPEMPIVRHLQGLWVSWVHEFEDGELGGGCFWQGVEGKDFGPGYLLEQGVTTTHNNITTTRKINSAGRLEGLDANIGGKAYSFTFNKSSSILHYFGEINTAGGRVPAKSWCWVEARNEMMTPDALDYVLRRYSLARQL